MTVRYGLPLGTMLLTVPWIAMFSRASSTLSYLLGVSFPLWVVPWGVLFLAAHLVALRRRSGERDWLSLTVLGSIWCLWIPTIDRWWSEGRYDVPPQSEWLRLVNVHLPIWLLLAVVAAALYLFRALRPEWRAWPQRAKIVAHAALLLGLLGLPMLFPAVKAHLVERKGGPGLLLLYPVAYLSLVLLGAAARSPGAVTARSLRTALLVLATSIGIAVGAVALGLISPEPNFESFAHSYLWQLFDVQALGLPFLGLATAWLALALLAKPPVTREPGGRTEK